MFYAVFMTWQGCERVECGSYEQAVECLEREGFHLDFNGCIDCEADAWIEDEAGKEIAHAID